jgi:hypothetical protein
VPRGRFLTYALLAEVVGSETAGLLFIDHSLVIVLGLMVYTVVPIELMQSAVQAMVYFFTVAGVAFGLVLCSRA